MMERKVYTVDEVGFDIIKPSPPKIIVLVKGTTRTSGWRNGRLVPHSNNPDSKRSGVFEFDFVADSPTDIAADVITPITAKYTFHSVALDVDNKRVAIYFLPYTFSE